MSYAIATSELTLTDIKAFRGSAAEAGIARALALGVASNRDELVVLEALPNTNFGALMYLTETYVTGALVAGWQAGGDGAGVGTVPIGQVAVFYKVANASAVVPPVVTAVRFQVGATGASTKAMFFIQLMEENKMESDMYLSEPVVYDPNDRIGIQVYATAIGAAERVSFGCFVIQKLGAEVS